MNRPPFVHRWTLCAAAPRDERAELAADMDDEFARRLAADGRRAARAWYRRQVRRSIVPLAGRRVGRRLQAGRPGLPVGVVQDLRLSVRSLLRSPAFAVATVAMLALGIGAFAVLYAFVDAIVVRPMPYGDRNDRLLTVHSVHPTLVADPADAAVSYPDLIDLAAGSASLAALEGAISRNVAVATDRATDRVLAASVTPGMFAMLGIEPLIGRAFRPDEGAGAGFETVTVVSHRIWRDLMGGDPDAVGGSVRLNDRAVTVIGVMPPGFMFPEEHELWLPFATSPMANRGNRSWLAIGLLRPGVSRADAAADLAAVAARLGERYPSTNRDWSVALFPLRDFFGSADDEGTLLAAVALLLLVGCANVAGLIVARGVARRRELTVRAALGAGRGRLVRWLLGETLVLSVAGGAIGLALAAWGLRAMVRWMPEPPPYWAVPVIDARVIAVAVLVTGLVALLSGLAPAIGLSRVRPSGVLAAGGRAATGGHRRLQATLVVAQVGISFSLVVGALLLAGSARALLTADAGFDHAPLLSARFYIAGDRYDDIAARTALVHEIVARVSALPGVRAVAATGAIPTDDGGADVRFVPPPRALLARDEVGGQLVPVTPSFWGAIGQPLVAGRTFSASEATDPNPGAVIVNRRLAEVFWPDESALDRVLVVADESGTTELRVVGVAPDLVYEEFGEVTPQSQLNVYVPYPVTGWRTQALLIDVDRTRDPSSLADAVRGEIRAVDSGLAVYDVRSMLGRREYNHWGDQLVGRTMTALAIAALLLACVGAYGIASHGVAARRREIGVRIAIGASGRDIRRLFLGVGARLALGGLATGLPLALFTARALESAVFGVTPWDLRLWLALPALLAAAILIASYWPAHRASRTNPAVTLRE